MPADKPKAEAPTQPPPRRWERGLVQVYTGDGKGKTTAALGLALRAAGQGFRVYIAQFMKGIPYGEVLALRQVAGITLRQFGRAEWVHPERVREEDRQAAQEGLQAAKAAVFSGEYDLVILDEINVALAWGLLPQAEVLALVSAKPPPVELVLTGRYAPAKVMELADLVTEMKLVKHPYDKGIRARRGIEF